jgi:hypothetical protein
MRGAFSMLLFNFAASAVVLYVVFLIFGEFHRLAEWSAGHAAPGGPTIPWLVALTPGAAVGYTAIWYWCVLAGRSRGVPWTGALLYGVLAALADLPVGGFVIGTVRGGPALGLIFALISLILLPGLFPALCAFGLAMGGLNALLAASWIEANRPGGE